ncbi:hypothetical protein Tco_0127263 [Tanacetum coccineum]
MCPYLKNMEGWKPKDLKSKSFANIQELFDKAMKRVNTFIDYRTELVEGSSENAEAEIAQESSSKRVGRITIKFRGGLLRLLDDLRVTADKFCVTTASINYRSSIRCAAFEALYGRKCRSPILWAEVEESSLIGPELVQETTDKVVLIKKKFKAARDRQKSYADSSRKPLEFEVGNRELLKILERIGPVAYRLRLPKKLSGVHDTYHVSNLNKCLADASLHVSLNEIKVDKTLRFVEEPVENSDCEVMRFLTSFLDDGRGSGSWMVLFVWSGYAAMRTFLWAGKVVSSKISCES